MLRLFYSLSCTILFMSVLGADFPQCDNEPMKSIIAVASNCSRAIYCNGMESVVLDCSKETPYFSTTDQKCHNSSTVCDNRPVIVHNMLTTTPLSVSTNNFSLNSNTPTTAISDLFTRSTTTSIQQSFPTTWSTNQADTTIREPLTSPAFTTSTSQPTSAATQAVPVFVQCPEVDDLRKPLFLPHPKSCSRYFLCYHGVATPMKCPNKLHFDVSQQTCNTPEQAKCQINFLIAREQCQRHNVGFYPHPTKCNYYYLCEYGFLMVMQCPFNMYWDYRRRICTMRSMVTCYNAVFPY